MNKKNITLISILALVLSTNYSLASEPDICLEKAMTQTAMNDCANINFQLADNELNRVYGTIQEAYADDKVFLKNLKQAQLAWIKLRDADFILKFPHAKDPTYYGSVFPMCADAYKTQLTLERVVFLKEWSIGAEEGDVCSGSQQSTELLKEAQSSSETCYQKFVDIKNGAGIIIQFSFAVTPNSDEVTGQYGYFPNNSLNKGESRQGTVKGKLKDNTIKAKYNFEYKGKKDTVNLQIKLKDNIAIIEGDEKDKALNLSSELTRYDCGA